MERNITMVALFAALIAALGLVPSLTLAFGIPISAQSLGVMLAGTVLGAKRGFLAALLLVVLVLLGLPLLAGGRGGLGVLAGPTVGFFLGWPLAALVTGFVTQSWRGAPVAIAASVGAILGGIVVLYGCGILGLSLIADKGLWASAVLMTPFLPGDAIKAVLAGLITQGLMRARPHAVLSRN
ncbi:BioY family transporter [Rhodobacteraceae bacterium]|nr:BioY family transporter [Paracoccaceae bacterium]